MSNQPFPSMSRPRPLSSYSSHSLPLHQTSHGAGPSYPLPRRPHTARTLRSSPLAGPSSSDETDDSPTGKPRYRPSRISTISNPTIPTIVSTSSTFLDVPKLKTSPSSLESVSGESTTTTAYSSASAAHDSSSMTTSSRLSSRFSKSLKSLNSSSASINSVKSSKSETLPPSPSVPGWVLRDQGKDFNTLPATRRPPSISRDPQQNWMAFTDPTPRFSRLSLGGEGVVMPVSAKSRSIHKSGSRPSSIISVTPTTPPSPRNDSWDSSIQSNSTSARITTNRLPSTSSSISSAQATLHIEVGPLPAFNGQEFGVLSTTGDEKGISFVRGKCSPDDTTSAKDTKRERKLVKRITSFVKLQPSTENLVYHTTCPVESTQKKVSGFRKKWNKLVASIRR